MTTPHLTIEHLRLLNPGRNQVAMKLGLQQALRQVRLQPARLPPGAVLVIRRLQSGRPFGLRAAEMHRWQKEVQSRIDDLARRAPRPGRQYVPPDAQSVLFFDDVELLVCYTRDMLARRTTWYWADLFPDAAYPGRPTGQQLLTGWQAYPQAIPHTLVALKPNEMRSALNSLNRTQISGLVHLLHQTFALPADVLEAAVPDPTASQSLAPQEPLPDRPGSLLMTLPAAPWHDWLPPQLFEHLSPQAEYILGLCHSLVYRPQQARRQHFAQAAKQWLEQTAIYPVSEDEQALLIPRPERRPSYTPPAEPIQSEPEAADAAAEFPLPEGAYTSLGGAIFLVNLLTRLRLPAIFPTLAELNPWELLGALTADLLADHFSLYHSDPLWDIINELAGLEPGDKWGRALTEADAFYLPPAWLAYISTETINCRLERRDGRSRLWYQEADLLIADLPDESEPLNNLLALYREADITLEVASQPGWTALPDNSSDIMFSELGWYVVRLRPFLTQFLQELTAEPVEAILHQPATLYHSRTHIDLRLSLEQISVPLRRAGLDRTPGWLPDYGYILTIYFE